MVPRHQAIIDTGCTEDKKEFSSDLSQLERIRQPNAHKLILHLQIIQMTPESVLARKSRYL